MVHVNWNSFPVCMWKPFLWSVHECTAVFLCVLSVINPLLWSFLQLHCSKHQKAELAPAPKNVQVLTLTVFTKDADLLSRLSSPSPSVLAVFLVLSKTPDPSSSTLTHCGPD